MSALFSTTQIVTLLVGAVAPFTVGLLTKASTGGNIKAILLALISAAVGVGNGFLNTPSNVKFDWQNAALMGAAAWVVAVATHYGFFKPTGISSWASGVFNVDVPLSPAYVPQHAIDTPISPAPVVATPDPSIVDPTVVATPDVPTITTPPDAVPAPVEAPAVSPGA